MYWQSVESAPGDVVERVGGFQSLFDGVATITLISMLGLRGAPRRWTPGALAAATLVWSFTWIGWFLRLRGLVSSPEAGYWALLASIAVVAVGTVIVVMGAARRRGAHRIRSAR